jgi:ferredoxin
MSEQLAVDRHACAGHGLCYGASPDLVDCDDHGDPVIVAHPVPAGLLDVARRLVELCPERALTLD